MYTRISAYLRRFSYALGTSISKQLEWIAKTLSEDEITQIFSVEIQKVTTSMCVD